jgi:hypothetical protein
MQDLKRPAAIWLKGILFLLIAVSSATLLLWEAASWRIALLLALVVWGSCRAYYFAFYVIQHYVDPMFRFSGLGAFLLYALRKRRQP